MILTLTSWSRGGDHYSSCAWPVSRARGSSLCCRGLLVGSRTGWSLLRQYWWAFSQIPFKLMVQCRSLNRPSSISYPVPDISVTSSFLGGVGKFSQRRWKMISLVLSSSGLLRYELALLAGVWRNSNAQIRTRNTNLRWRVPLDTFYPPNTSSVARSYYPIGYG